MSYASNTYVSPERSQSEIQQLLRKYGADKFGVMEDSGGAHVLFSIKGLMVQMSIPLPDRADDAFTKTPQGKPRSIDQQRRLYDQDVKARWRALMLVIKAKLVAIETKVSTLEQEFMAWVIMPDGRSLGDHIIPKLADVVKSGKTPDLLRLGNR